ncbi:hypothetical protein AURANDRAFT_27088 [Aureococcus anophagefferens]|uniref:Endonuclease V n=1 Tax=Aureococcus anophagefferens TaxID=44056 RepID=F0YA58_AURAN|nr:hypothetical protein AURANDRAFT_27088 [Aureococcus anophagefferens]EGB07873.1 hypothetical protein AURANDRAFT_27088 [Aureococcus anophagefferens]|eukprot:XP_009037250.1 hypothetical protein AURANDRAFT_27088 [Aureococcus anophagefferens]
MIARPKSAETSGKWPREEPLKLGISHSCPAQELLRQLRTDDGPDVAACAASLAARDGATWLVAGLDMSYFPDDDGAAVASLVVVELPSRRRVHAIHENVRVEGPYIPGFLAFREAPHYCRLLDRLRRDRPDVVPVACLVDGNGVLRPPARTSNPTSMHPRGFGAASHVGVAASIPTVGVAKSLLAVDGLDERTVREGCAAAGLGFGGHTPLVGDSGRTWGAALRSSEPPPKRETTGQDAAFRPIFVSVGHGVCLRTAVALTTACCAYRVPEPIRLADLEGRDVVRTMCAV